LAVCEGGDDRVGYFHRLLLRTKAAPAEGLCIAWTREPLTGAFKLRKPWRSGAVERHAAEYTDQPEDDEDNQYQTKYAAEPGSSVTIVTVIATAAAEQND
jgi:hypothetical protein